ncbi:hypothetical protein JW756_04025 [Candidatus Woesearchaeota archaeon]|nr:hypothetical protein [Candidatus Woesearchaeota archaeon]
MESQFVTITEIIDITMPIKRMIEELGFESEKIIFSPDQRFEHPEAIKRNSTIYSNSLRKGDSVVTYDFEVTKKKKGNAFYRLGMRVEEGKPDSEAKRKELAHMIEGRTVPLNDLGDSVKAVFEKSMQPRLYEVINHKL